MGLPHPSRQMPSPTESESSAPSHEVADVPRAPTRAGLLRQHARLAGLDSAPWLHEEVARRLAAKLEPIRLQPTDWVDWSAFLGAGRSPVVERYPQARRWVVEPTHGLARRSEAQARGATSWLTRPWQALRRERPTVLVEPVAQAPWPEAGAHMLWANMTLHGAPDVPALLTTWHRHLAVGGFLMCSGLGPDTARELRSLYRELDWPTPTIDFIDMHDLGDELVRAGFADPVMDMERLTLTWATAEDMLAELRTWGGNVARGRFSGLRTPRWRQTLLDSITQRLSRTDGRVALTVELIYGHAIKPEPRVAVASEARISLDDMRRMVRSKGHP
jgi:malonyl-CoA O-methyltransferase